jgi:hypothetical protein
MARTIPTTGDRKIKTIGLTHPCEDQGFETRMSDRCAAITAYQSVRRAGGQAEDECDEVPGNRAEQSR